MQKQFYSSGFLYHPSTHQILLQQFKTENEIILVLFRGQSCNGHTPKAIFKKCVEKTLKMSIPESSIYPVYDYVHDQLGEHFIFFVEVTEPAPEVYTSKKNTEWVPLAKLSKLPMSEQTRHDIVVGERVIRSLMERAQPSAPTQRHH